MEKRKMILLAIAGVALIVAAVLIYRSLGGGGEGQPTINNPPQPQQPADEDPGVVIDLGQG